MRIKVKVVPGSSQHCLKEENGLYKAYIHSSPEKGKANKELVEMLAEHFEVSKSKVTIVRGASTREKTIEITG